MTVKIKSQDSGARIQEPGGAEASGTYPDLSAVVQDDEGGRDSRTQPGVLTPGNDPKSPRPNGAVRLTRLRRLQNEWNTQPMICRPFSFANPAAARCNSGRARCLSDVACGLTFISSSARRSRIPARREQVYVINLVKLWIWSVLGSGKTDREDAIPPGRRSGCVTRTKNEEPCQGGSCYCVSTRAKYLALSPVIPSGYPTPTEIAPLPKSFGRRS